MCGIVAVISCTVGDHDDTCRTGDGGAGHTDAIRESLQQACKRRGPDEQSTLKHASRSHTFSLHASVLSLRGIGITAQPLTSNDGRFHLAWNGQVFRHYSHGGDEDRSDDSALLRAENNDAEQLLRLIENAARGLDSAASAAAAIASVLRTVEGPYAFVLIDVHQQSLLFGRDPLGRRSLLMQKTTRDTQLELLLCSVADQDTVAADSSLVEVDCTSLWKLDLESDDLLEPVAVARGLEPFVLSDLNLLGKSTITTDSSQVDSRIETARAFCQVLTDSVRRRVTTIRPYTANNSAHVAVLFSGGLDCSTLALLAHPFIPPDQPIDLLNVALENPRSLQAARARTKGKEDVVDPYDVPDRQTGVATYRELCRLVPGRRWNFVQVDVPYSEYCAAKEEIMTIMHPCNSVMDLSIAAALYFAARGRGTLLHSGESYATPARILLSGLGADELLGGYSRHRAAFAREGYEALAGELQMDLDRLPTRNLGRDDRVLSSHAKEARYPFLDRQVIRHLCSLRIQDKMSFHADLPTQPQPSPSPQPAEAQDSDHELFYPGDKLLLRLVASELLGLHGAARLKKRAIQFGSRSAKMEIEPRGGKVKGHEALRSRDVD